MYVTKVTSFMSFFPLVIGLFVFMSVYVDDFKCRAMQVAIGYGISRIKIVFVKLLESTILLLSIAVIIGVLVLYTPVILDLNPNTQHFISIELTMALEMLRTLAYLTLSSILVFFFHDVSYGIITYVMFSSKTVYIVMSMIMGQELLVNTIGDLRKYFYTSLLYTVKDEMINGKPFIMTFIAALLIYIIFPTAIAMIGFCKKELEF